MAINHLALLKHAFAASLKAGKAILDVYNSNNFEIEHKADNSPLTLADRMAHETILLHLAPTGLPVLSEESKQTEYAERKSWDVFWMVDPLDGTKEFIKRNGEFTVNIALIENQTPTLGVIYAPATDVIYFGGTNLGAFKLTNASGYSDPAGDLITKATTLPCIRHSSIGIVGSRSHRNKETDAFIQGLKRKYPDARIVSTGSSLKLCMIAEGEADVYPRFAPTCEWDTAAGQAIVQASGGRVIEAGSEKPVKYNKKEILNPWFIAMSKSFDN